MKAWEFILILLVCVGLIFILQTHILKSVEENPSVSFEPGICPNCGEKLVKGVYGQNSPHFIWYCPDCP